MEEIKHGNKKQARLHFLFDHFDRGMEKVDNSNFPVGFLFRLPFLIEQEKNHIENAPNPTPSFVEPCIVSDPNLPGASPP